MTDFVKKTKLTELVNKIPEVSGFATKTALTAVQNKIPDVTLVKKTNFAGRISFGDGAQNYLVLYRYLKKMVIVTIFHHVNLKDCLMKLLSLLLRVITVLLQH